MNPLRFGWIVLAAASLSLGCVRATDQQVQDQVKRVLAGESQGTLDHMRQDQNATLKLFYSDSIRFYEALHDGYHSLGLECFNLSNDLTQRGLKEEGDRMAIQAKMYADFSKAMESNANERRLALEKLEKEAATAPAPAAPGQNPISPPAQRGASGTATGAGPGANSGTGSGAALRVSPGGNNTAPGGSGAANASAARSNPGSAFADPPASTTTPRPTDVTPIEAIR